MLPTVTVPGGAPMNVAFHLKKLGAEPALISKIGTDDWGVKLVKMINENGIGNFIQTDPVLETGKVNAVIHPGNEVKYDIVKPVAWDAIEREDRFENLIQNANCFVFGSLAARSRITRNTLYQLLAMSNFKVLDINLRPPHYTKTTVEQLLSKADLLKLNQAELELITGWFANYQSDIERIRLLQDKFHIPDIVVTKGSDGSIFNRKGIIYEHPGFKVNVADTVGSGDSFLAALLAKLLVNTSPAEALEFASATGAVMASYTGACPDYTVKEINALIQYSNLQNTSDTIHNHDQNFFFNF
jgi:fructokinase